MCLLLHHNTVNCKWWAFPKMVTPFPLTSLPSLIHPLRVHLSTPHVSMCARLHYKEEGWMTNKISYSTGKVQDKWALNKTMPPNPPHK